MKEKMRIAVIGCGRFAKNFVLLFKNHPVVEKVWVCDLKKERAEEYSKAYNVEIMPSFEEALSRKDVNAVAIFTCRYQHGPMVIKALKAGKHVYSSVPCSIDVNDFFEIAKLVKETRLTYSMGETGFYRAPAIFCRQEFEKGTFGKFVYGEAQYNHDIRNMEESFKSSGGDRWKEYAGIPPFFYPSHSTAMVLSAMPGVYAKRVTAMGFKGSPRTDIYGVDGQNLYNNPFSAESMLLELSNGGIARISENRCVAWSNPATYISQYYGTEGCYEFSVARHTQSLWNAQGEGPINLVDVTKELQPASVYDLINTDYDLAIKSIGEGAGYYETSPVQPTHRLPKEYENIHNGHNGTHHFLIDEFCKACYTGKLSPTNIWAAARYNIPGLTAHESAMNGGKVMDVIDLGNPPEDWEVLEYDR